MKRRCILVPLDGLDRARAALPHACALARAYGTGIELLSVVEDLGDSDHSNRLEAMVAEGLGHYLQIEGEQLRAAGFAVELCVRRGEAAETILMHAEKRRARAVVLSTHGQDGFNSHSLGSVADRVIGEARCPVLAVAPPSYRISCRGWRPQRLLVPLDGSAQAEQALAAANELAATFGAEVLLALVQPRLNIPMAIVGDAGPEPTALERAAGARAAIYVDLVRAAAPCGIHVRKMSLRDGAAGRLIDLVESEAVDLVVITSHRRGGASGQSLGSVAREVVRHGIPTLIVHPEAAGAGVTAPPELVHA